jgi:hypothetical protein
MSGSFPSSISESSSAGDFPFPFNLALSHEPPCGAMSRFDLSSPAPSFARTVACLCFATFFACGALHTLELRNTASPAA